MRCAAMLSVGVTLNLFSRKSSSLSESLSFRSLSIVALRIQTATLMFCARAMAGTLVARHQYALRWLA